MIGLILICAILMSALLQLLLRGGDAGATAPEGLRRAARWLLAAGVVISIAPLLPLLVDAPGMRSAMDFVVLFGYLILSLGMLLPTWIWLFVAWRNSATRGATGFVTGAAVASAALAVMFYAQLFSGDADAQDGIIVQLVPLMQLGITAISSILRRLLDSRMTPAHESGHKDPHRASYS